MLIHHPGRRSGYTLLEILLASAIALILLAALYVAMDVTIVRMDANRELVNSNDFSRAVFNRISTDLTASLGVMPPNSGGANSSSGGGGEAVLTEPVEGEGGTGDETVPAPVTNYDFQSGVIGGEKVLTAFTSRVPPALVDINIAANPDIQSPSDLQRVTYYLGSSGGLCRQLRPWITADGVGNTVEPDYSTEELDLIAPEVLDITFEYFDGGVWLGEWDGSQTNLDGASVQGPPRAIRVTLLLEVPARGNTKIEKTVQQVFVIRAAVGTYAPPSAEVTPATDGTMP